MAHISVSQKRLTRDLSGYEYQHISSGRTTFIYKNKNVDIVHDNCYPFRPPKITIDNIRLIYDRSLFPKRLWKKHYDEFNKCMCCENIQCPAKWSPALNIFDIINEYESFKERLKTIQKKYMFSFVNLPDDMIYEINGYL
jgi:ubiquitin-protein ligase